MQRDVILNSVLDQILVGGEELLLVLQRKLFGAVLVLGFTGVIPLHHQGFEGHLLNLGLVLCGGGLFLSVELCLSLPRFHVVLPGD